MLCSVSNKENQQISINYKFYEKKLAKHRLSYNIIRRHDGLKFVLKCKVVCSKQFMFRVK